jgi:hypothetical protein
VGEKLGEETQDEEEGEDMTKWERFYRAVGGKGPENNLQSMRGKFYFASWLANKLIHLGFLSRDPVLSSTKQGYYTNFKWQWRFWRGPYKNVIEQAKREGKAWAQFDMGWWGPR